MAKRIKKLKKGIISLKEQIEKHFEKLDMDIEEKNAEVGRYHAKEIDLSLIRTLERKLEMLGLTDEDINTYKERLNKAKEELKSLE